MKHLCDGTRLAGYAFAQITKWPLYLFLLFVWSNAGHLAAQADAFTITVKTDKPGTSNNTSFTIPTFPRAIYNYQVDWNNDGVYEQTGIKTNITRNFGTAGTYTIRIRGIFPRIFFHSGGDCLKLLDIVRWGTNPWTSMENAFRGCANLNISASDVPNLSRVTNRYELYQLLRYNNRLGNKSNDS